jgi:hypothetical protein
MALDQSIQLLKLLAPIAGALPVGGEQLKGALEAASQICEMAKVCGKILSKNCVVFIVHHQ